MAKLFFYYSTMNAGKSTSLLQAAYNYRERGMETLLYTAKLDHRSGGQIASRIGLAMDARHFDPETDFWGECEAAKNVACILIDESQFLKKNQVSQLCKVVDERNIPVMCYGIRTDFQGELFEGSASLLAWADTLQELKTICSCGRKATMVVRMKADGQVERFGDQIEVGGNERYLPLCRKHFTQAINNGVMPAFEKNS
jgi:thymidine kinase